MEEEREHHHREIDQSLALSVRIMLTAPLLIPCINRNGKGGGNAKGDREGNTRTLNEKHIAGEVMFEFVDMMSSPKLSPINFGARPFEYIKDANSKVLIK
ncbi:hypothetical protein Golob_017494, partial [Gossypium lobatum]|nr:hypothetical protein [Gossypium lobatum]